MSQKFIVTLSYECRDRKQFVVRDSGDGAGIVLSLTENADTPTLIKDIIEECISSTDFEGDTVTVTEVTEVK